MLVVRKAIDEDSRDIFDWRNDELTRQMSHNTDFVDWDSHSNWLYSSLINEKRLLIMCEKEDNFEKIAIVRFDVEEGRALVSINLKPNQRGKGLAKLCLTKSIEYFTKHFSDTMKIVAEIKEDNIASQKTFLSTGFEKYNRENNVGFYEKLIVISKNNGKKILFLGYGQSQKKLIDALVANNCIVEYTEEEIEAIKGYDCLVSYGYRHILKQNVIDGFDCPIFNLHISYLPYNRGAHPNFWSFYDNTPSGVTIHLIDSGVDTGQIVKQKYVNFQESNDTFSKTYSTLTENMENLFIEFLPSLLTDTWTAKKQRGIGTHHYVRDLPTNFSGWSSVITEEIRRLKNEGLANGSQ